MNKLFKHINFKILKETIKKQLQLENNSLDNE